MYSLVATALLIASAAPANGVTAGEAVEWSYLYDLSDIHGAVPAEFASLAVDETAHEVFVVARGVRIFNDRGMELYDFGDDEAIGSVTDVAIWPDGNMVLLTRVGGKRTLLDCNFRGEPRGRIRLTGLPAELADFQVTALATHGDELFLIDRETSRVVVTDARGAFRRALDLTKVLGLDSDDREDNAVSGFAVDRQGNLLVTIPALFTAYVITPAGDVRGFGGPGSKPGRFNVAGGIAADESGTIYVTDVLRSVVMVFDRDLRFRGEFGYYGAHPGNLNTPVDIVAAGGAIYVSQGADRAIAAFRVSAPPQLLESGLPAMGQGSSSETTSATPAVSLVSNASKEKDR